VNRDGVAQWSEWWTGSPEVPGPNAAHCYISAISKEGTG